MSAQFINVPALSNLAKHTNLKNSLEYNQTMAEHYKALHERYRKKGLYFKSYFSYFRMKLYEETAIRIQLEKAVNVQNLESYDRAILN